MIKSILKKIFPIRVLKNAFLMLNKFKIKTLDRFFFPERIFQKKDYLIYEETNPFLDNKISITDFPKDIQEKLELWLNPSWRQDQYFLHYKDTAYIDPDSGWAITGGHQLIYPSLGFSRAPYVKKPRLLKSYLKKNNTANLSKIISLRDTGEENYFHFYNDVIAKLFFIEDQNFNIKDYTVVISEKLYRKEFFQYFFKNTMLKDLTWHIQRTEWVHFEEALFCKPYTHTKRYLSSAVSLVKTKSRVTLVRRIFLIRPKSSMRFIENMDELAPLLKLHKFEVIEAGSLKVSDQIKLFAECQYLISVHGAGLTNMIFRQGNPLTILEIIHPSPYIPFHYIMLAHQYNYKYNILLGERGMLQHQGGFRVDPIRLEKEVEKMLMSRE